MKTRYPFIACLTFVFGNALAKNPTYEIGRAHV